MRRLLFVVVALVSSLVAIALVWRRNRRLGSRFMNTVVNPALIRQGLAGKGRSEIGTLEHIGRRSGIRRLTPVHPEPAGDGFRIIVPLGEESAWARNVLAAGHCRLQLHDMVYDLDEPRLVSPAELDGIAPIARTLEGALGFQYLVLHRFGATPGALEPVTTAEPEAGEVVTEPAAAAAEPEAVPAG